MVPLICGIFAGHVTMLNLEFDEFQRGMSRDSLHSWSPRIVLQYMTEEDNPNLRDGTDQTSAGGDDNDPTEEDNAGIPEEVLK